MSNVIDDWAKDERKGDFYWLNKNNLIELKEKIAEAIDKLKCHCECCAFSEEHSEEEILINKIELKKELIGEEELEDESSNLSEDTNSQGIRKVDSNKPKGEETNPSDTLKPFDKIMRVQYLSDIPTFLFDSDTLKPFDKIMRELKKKAVNRG